MNLIYALQDADNPNSLSSRFRRARARRIVELIQAAHAERGEVRMIDLGGEPDYWARNFDRAFLDASKVHITLVNPQAFRVDDPLFTATVGDACALPEQADLSFDLVHSNSVVEHVGDWPRMEAFAGEVRRRRPPSAASRLHVRPRNWNGPGRS